MNNHDCIREIKVDFFQFGADLGTWKLILFWLKKGFTSTGVWDVWGLGEGREIRFWHVLIEFYVDTALNYRSVVS